MRVACHTLGCKLNRFETEALAESLRAAGHQVVPFRETADIYLINTCTVTARADAECRKVIRRAARENPRALIAAVGCYAERDRQALAALPGVRLVLGNREKARLAQHLAALLEGRPVAAPQAEDERDGRFPRLASFGERTRAFVKIQDGCPNRCSYCVVWQVRGPQRSEEGERIVDQVRRLAGAGYREVVLTGVHLGSWGSDLAPPLTLARLLEELSALPDGPRIRLSSLEPRELDERLLEAVGGSDRICRHFHVPLQSGSDRILELMNRGYRADEYRRRVSGLAGAFPGAGLGTDVIVGFPGETGEDFARTMALVEELPFTYLHVFPYSRRPGTAAADLPGQVPREVKEERGRLLRALGQAKAEAFRRTFLQREVTCLVETRRDLPSGLLRGITDYYLKILLPGPDDLMNTFVGVTVERVEGKEIHGRVTR